MSESHSESDPGANGTPTVCFLWGAARSGTNVITRHLNESPDILCYNEDDPRAFDNFFLFDHEILRGLVARRTERAVFFKAFNDTPRAAEVMRDFDGSRAIYAVREPSATIASFAGTWSTRGATLWANRLIEASRGPRGALARLGATSETAAADIRRSASEAARLLESHEHTDHNVAAIYYLWQHSFFDRLMSTHGERVRVVDYGRLTADPVREMRDVARWFGVSLDMDSTEGWHRGGRSGGDRLTPDAALLERCERLYASIIDR